MKLSHNSEKASPQFNFVLFGKSGSGKSASGNTILGRKAFISKRSPSSVTRDVQIEHGRVSGAPVTVYDTPGFCNTELSDDEIRLEYQSVFRSCESESDICTYLLVIRADRFTEEEQNTVQKIELMLGESRMENTWILFTGGDELEEEDQTIEEFISNTEPLKELVQRYNNRYHVFNNRINSDCGQVNHLLRKVCKKFIKSAPHLRRKTTKTTSAISSAPDRRIVLLGKTGAGKSAAGNTILGKKRFKSDFSMNSVTTKCKACQGHVGDRNVSVIDTPGLFDTSADLCEIAEEMGRSICLSSPGPHAFLIVLPVNMGFTDQEQQIIQLIEMIFGEEVRKYSMVLFTYGDQLEGRNVENLIKENKSLCELVQQCGGGYHVFNNKDLRNREQVSELLQKIDRMLEENGGTCYSNEMFEEAAKLRQEEEERVRRDEETRQRQQEIKINARLRQMEMFKEEARFRQEEEEERVIQRQGKEKETSHVRDQRRPEGFSRFISKYWKRIAVGVVGVIGVAVLAAPIGVGVAAGGAAAARAAASIGVAAGAAAYYIANERRQ